LFRWSLPACTRSLVGVFFSVALAGAAAEAIGGGEPSFSDGVDVAWTRLSGIAGWAGYSIFVALVLGFVKSIKGLRWLGIAAEVAWSFATIFVVPLIALEGLDSGSARRHSFQLAKANWVTEAAGLGALRAVLFLPGLLFYLDGSCSSPGTCTRSQARRCSGPCCSAGSAWASPRASSGRCSQSRSTATRRRVGRPERFGWGECRL
jgi:hypothetical protein